MVHRQVSTVREPGRFRVMLPSKNVSTIYILGLMLLPSFPGFEVHQKQICSEPNLIRRKVGFQY